MLKHENLTKQTIGAAMEVHRAPGPGLLTSQGTLLEPGPRFDLLAEREVVVALKTIEKVLPVHEMQLLTYMKLLTVYLGLLVTCHASLLIEGARGLVL